jgi:hypothetical protein
MLSEGILAFFEDLDPSAYDRFRRAYALSVSIGDCDLQALTSAWMAHIEFNERRYSAMVSSANHCLAIYPRGSTAAHSRLLMVLANANLYAGNVSKANTHFERARSIAVTDGDRATVGAIVYNRAALMLNNFRLQAFVDVGESIDLSFLSVAVESSTAFQGITENRSLVELPIMNQARLAMIRGDFSYALAAIDGIRNSEYRHRGGAKDPLLDIEYATCLAKTGDIDRAADIMYGTDFSRYAELDNDDQIIFFSQLIGVCQDTRRNSPIEDSHILMQSAISRFTDELSALRGAVVSMNSLFDGSPQDKRE